MTEIERIRKSYFPETLSCILIAESPPKNPSRFFYYPDVKEHDHLFLAVMRALYPLMLESYIAKSRDTNLKIDLLKRFQSDGFYLIDLFESSSEIRKENEQKAVKEIMGSLDEIATRETPVILIKSNVFDILVSPLVEAGYRRVIQERIPFPLYQWKTVFSEKFSCALSKAGLKIAETNHPR